MKKIYSMGLLRKCKFVPFILIMMLVHLPKMSASTLPLYGTNDIASVTQLKVSGTIRDSKGEALAGATVVIKGTTIGVSSDANGKFELSVDSKDAILVIKFVGMITQEITVGDKTNFDIIMADDLTQLDEVVVVGYGTTKKTDLTGAVASVKEDEITSMSSGDILSGIQGKMAGVHIAPNSGAPGDNPIVRIRGIGTINNSDPIYVVDGFQVSNISYLSVNDIESVEVLKDASATAIYGSRGANGVILVTTKKGGKDGRQISVNYNIGVQSASKKIDMLNAWQFATLFREAHSNSGVTLSAYEDAVTKFVIDNKYEGTDWQDEIFMKNTPVQNFNFSLSGKEGNNSYLTSIYYNSNKGLIKNNDFSKLNIRLHDNYAVSDKITWTFDVNYSTINKHDIDGGALTSALYMDPIAPAWDDNTNNYGDRTFPQIEAANPAMLVDNAKYDRLSYTNRFVGNTSINIVDLFIKGLSFDSRFGFDNLTRKGKGYYPKYYISPSSYNAESSLYQNNTSIISKLWSNYFTYTKKLNQTNVNVMLGMEMQSFQHEYVSGMVWNVPNDPNQMYFDLSQNFDRKSLDGNFYESALLSYFARANLKFYDKYLITATIRADGSSKFLGDNRWGYFPSVAAGWDIKKEAFMNDVDFVSALKLRFGWGIVGNQNSLNNPYVYASTITSETNPYMFGGVIVNGYYPAELANKDIKWESTETYNIGVDLALLSNKLTVDANLFQNTTRDMIATPLAPVYAGYNAVPSNIGSMRNKGIELGLGHKNSIGNLTYSINLNFTSLNNEVLSLGTSTAIRAGMVARLDPTTYTDVGTEIGAFYGLKTRGIFTQASLDALHAEYPLYQPTAQPGDVWFADFDGDHKIDKNNDRQYLGSAVPDFTSGLNIQLQWKNIGLSCYILGSYGNEIVNGQYVYIYGSNIKSNWSAEMWNRSHDGVITDMPRLDIADINGNTSTFSDRFIEDGSYLRFKNIQISYNLPQAICQKLTLSDCRFYVSADNLFTLSGYSGWDPEAVSFGTLDGGVDYGTYPLPRVISLGLNLNF